MPTFPMVLVSFIFRWIFPVVLPWGIQQCGRCQWTLYWLHAESDICVRYQRFHLYIQIFFKVDLQIKQKAIWSSWNFSPYKNNTILRGTLCWLENLTESWTGALSLETLLKEQYIKILIFRAQVMKKLIHMQNSHAKSGEKTVTHLSQCLWFKS